MDPFTRLVNTPARLSDLLRHLRGAAGLTQAELAAASGLHVSTVSAVEHGRPATPATRLALLQALAGEVHPADLTGLPGSAVLAALAGG
jgi:transcriptional regulator with XRE-family HTH domain